MSDLMLEQTTQASGLQRLSAALDHVAERPGIAALTRIALTAAADGATVAIGLVGKHVLGRMREWRKEAALSTVHQNIAEDAQRAFDKATVARQEGREWLVHSPGNPDLVRMDELEFASFRRRIASTGETLVTMVVSGDHAANLTAHLTRFVGGVIHGETMEEPAVVRATAQGIERSFFSSGQRLQGPVTAEPEITYQDAPAAPRI